MKVIKGIAFFFFFAILFGSCFYPPEFPDVPEIKFREIIFVDNADPSDKDTLGLILEFTDGDGDLGLDPTIPAHIAAPYHNANYFRTNANGELVPVESSVISVQGPNNTTSFLDKLEFSDPEAGDLIFARTRKLNPAYASLPGYDCVNYTYRTFTIDPSDLAALDDISVISDTLVNQSNGSQLLVVEDTLYFESNPDHYNIEIDFLVFDEVAKVYNEFDWRQPHYCSTFDGRFPVLSDSESALDGTLTYRMESIGFRPLFDGKTLKLRVQIKDRERHKSNMIETDPFTLESIRGKHIPG